MTRYPHQTSRTKRDSSKRFSVEALESRLCLSHWGSPAVPAFSSLPGADHTIYLDFDGEVVENTNWNSYYNQASLDAPPYDIDGNPGSFNATELARIEEAWNRTAEDFAPFNVNVTTIDPGIEALRKAGGGDSQWGVRAIVTKESNMVTDPAERCGCGGIAYINSFNWSSDTPVWVYTTGGKSVAEAASHEAGHALGLSHDGLLSGTTYYSGHDGVGEEGPGWAPIMGVGYYETVTQWDKGEYYNSNNADSGANYGKGPDDLNIITTYNGFNYRNDDHANGNAGATSLGVSGTTVNDAGIIETTGDVDVFSFTTGSGTVTLNVDPFTPGPNLDVKAELFDSGGNLVTSSDPADTLDVSLLANLAAGQYYLHVDGIGVGNPAANSPTGYSEYASLGRYTITGTIVDSGALPQLSINDVTVNESAGTATFIVSVSGTVNDTVTVDYDTVNDSASAGSDYAAQSGQLTFNPNGPTSLPISVSIIDDGTTEGSEDFYVDLSNVTGGSIADGRGIATIEDNDTDVTINDVSANEGNLAKGKKNGGNQTFKEFVFTISLSNAVGHVVTVNYATQDGSATTADGDYQQDNDSVVFGVGETTKTVTVTVVGDNTQEPDETFSVVLSNVTGGNLADDTGTGTILDDDSGGGGGGGGNGNGNGKPKRGSEANPILAEADPIWFFEAPGEHNHDHELDAHTHVAAAQLAYAHQPTLVLAMASVKSIADGAQFADAALTASSSDDVCATPARRTHLFANGRDLADLASQRSAQMDDALFGPLIDDLLEVPAF